MKPSLAERIQAGLGPLRRQPRLRAGIWLVAALVLFNFVFVLADARRALMPEIQRSANLHARLERVLAEADWSERAVAAQTRLAVLEDRLWLAESAALARAEFQTWLERQAGRVDMDVEMRVPLPLDELPEVHRVAASLRLEGSPGEILGLLGRLLQSERRVIVDAFSLELQRRRPASIELHALYRIPAEEPGG